MNKVLFFLLALCQFHNYGKNYQTNENIEHHYDHKKDNNDFRKIYQDVEDDTNVNLSDATYSNSISNANQENRSYDRKKRQCRTCSCWNNSECSCCKTKKTATGMIVGTAAGAGIGYAANGATGALIGGPIGFAAGALFSQIE